MKPQLARRALEVGFTGIGSFVGAAVGGGAAWAIPGALVGLLCAVGIEWGIGIRAKLKRLAELEREISSLRQQQELFRHQKELAERESAVSAAWTEVFGGVVSEAIGTGQVVPFPAILARAEMTLKSRGLDVPVTPPPTNPPLPPAPS